MSTIKRCPFCKRNKAKALQEQVSKRTICDFVQCPFVDEIKKTIEEKRKMTIIKKPKPMINVEKPPKLVINVKKKQ
jgi:hypothetical protein